MMIPIHHLPLLATLLTPSLNQAPWPWDRRIKGFVHQTCPTHPHRVPPEIGELILAYSQPPKLPTTCTAILKGHNSWVTALAWLSDGLLASASNDRGVRVWDTRTSTCTALLKGHTSWVNTVAWSPEGGLASAGKDHTIRLWNPATATCTNILHEHTGRVADLAWSPEDLLASASYDRTLRLWDYRSNSCTMIFQGHTDLVKGVAWSPHGVLASASQDQCVRLWDLRTAACTAILQGHTDKVWSVAWSPDGLLASSSYDGTVRVWDLQHPKGMITPGRFSSHSSTQGEYTTILQGHTHAVCSVAWSPDGVLASADCEKTIRLWDLQDPKEVITPGWLGRHTRIQDPCKATLKGHTGNVLAVAWSNDGVLASSGTDQTLRLWHPV